MKIMFAGTIGAAALLAAAPAIAATPFDLEGVAAGSYASLVVDDGPVQLTITSEGGGVVLVGDSNVALIGKGAASVRDGRFSAKRFTFNQSIGSITFNYGDAGGDDDNPVNVAAFDDLGVLLGTVVGSYDRDESLGGSITSTFSGARYYILSSGSGDANPNSLFWDVASYSLAGGGVPEPATWALMILGFGAVGGAMRRRSGRAAAVAA
ncbi:hypothetical protein ASG29_09005 [Sphingomonas sp. Leaf412]|uniref:PEPxxWA-CTERM sorting domain-containing protein n=1 Tax=Sphingomonas sp. Leaf412 TaxID=1736370 RepID=UPI0006F43CAB|nr:PEPxxWA-CTERM sorting domain-containing protein [Sphingomonas sp. Leaf412]KQT31991.1 hypothetical protein ASG29_09005 [Sphingomonas sp. Leaf412]